MEIENGDSFIHVECIQEMDKIMNKEFEKLYQNKNENLQPAGINGNSRKEEDRQYSNQDEDLQSAGRYVNSKNEEDHPPSTSPTGQDEKKSQGKISMPQTTPSPPSSKYPSAAKIMISRNVRKIA